MTSAPECRSMPVGIPGKRLADAGQRPGQRHGAHLASNRPMILYTIRRLVLLIPVLVGLSLLVFAISHLLPGDPVKLAAGPQATQAEIQALARELGTDRPLPVQYWTYATGLLKGDWGQSVLTRRPVWEDLRIYLPATLELVIAAMLLAVAIGIPAGMISAVYANRWPDYTSRVLSLAAISMPRFFLGLLLQLAFAMWLLWLPLGGRFPIIDEPPRFVTGFLTIDSIIAGDWTALAISLKHLALPAAAMCLVAARHHHPHDARVDAGGAAAGLRAHRARARPVAAADRVQVRLQERAVRHAHRHRALCRLAARRHGAGRDGVRLARHRPLRHQGHRDAGFHAGHGRHARHRHHLRPVQSRRRSHLRRDQSQGRATNERRSGNRPAQRALVRAGRTGVAAPIASGRARSASSGSSSWCCCWSWPWSARSSCRIPSMSPAASARRSASARPPRRPGSAPTSWGRTCSRSSWPARASRCSPASPSWSSPPSSARSSARSPAISAAGSTRC